MSKAVRNAVILGLSLSFLYSILTSYEKFVDGQIGVKIRQQFANEFQFPSVTVCNYVTFWLRDASRGTPKSFRGLLSDEDAKPPQVWATLISGDEILE